MAALRGSAEMPPQRRLILRVDELDAEALGVMADDPRPQLAEHDLGADLRPRRRADRRAGDGDVEHLAVEVMPSASCSCCRPLLGAMRSWRRSSAPSSSERLASQVSVAASFSRLCWVAASLKAKPPSNSRTTVPSMPPIWSKKATTRSPIANRDRGHGPDGCAAGRDIDQLAGMLLLVLAHEAARATRRRSVCGGGGRVRRASAGPAERRAKVVGLPDIEHLRAVLGVPAHGGEDCCDPQANAGARG